MDVARTIAPRVVEARGWLLAVPHNDDASVGAAADAMRIALGAGLVLHASAHLVDLGAEHKDLASRGKVHF